MTSTQNQKTLKNILRNKIHYLFFAVGTIVVGLASRRFSEYLPDIVNLGLGDALWALMMYWIMGFFFSRASILRLAFISLSICFLVEFSQLIDTEWLNALRNHKLGALVLGKGFLWSDLLAYSAGVGFGMLFEFVNFRKMRT
ncbi:MAG: DUF2809 domain-containing protein [Schleiferiaceae bacterium]